MIKLPELYFRCDYNGLYFRFLFQRYLFVFNSTNDKSPLDSGYTNISFDKLLEYKIFIRFTDKSIYIENDDYCLIYLFEKLTNEEFLEIFIKWRLHSLVNLFGNLYLVEFGA